MKINSILIVGGGSSGWMTAAGLAKRFADVKDLKISLVESKTIPTIGVGESTIASINTFLNVLGLEDEDWMPECEATYKNSIRFTDFRDNDTVFEYPFGGSFYHTKSQVMTWCEMATKHDMPPESFAEFYSENTFLARYNRCTKNEKGYLDSFNFKNDTAYHMNATLFGQYLKDKICLPLGVEHHIDDVVDLPLNEDGSLAKVVCASGKELTADLYIDCTGFKSMILEKTMGSEFKSFKPWLLNDKAIATTIPYIDKEEEMHNVTNCTAIEAGWVWNIPLWTRIGTGYVYSSDFATKEEAEAQFRKHLARDPRFAERAEKAEFRHIDIRHGVRKEAFVKNVVGIGLAFGFVEPLESTGLVSTHSNIIRLIDLLDRRKFKINQFDKDGYNLAAGHEMEGFRDFVAMHYAVSSRCDTPYWKHITQEKSFKDTDPNGAEKIVNNMTFNDSFNGAMHALNIHKVWLPTGAGWNYIMAGMGYNPQGKYFQSVLCDMVPGKDAEITQFYNEWMQHRENIIKYVEVLPTHYQFLKENIYKEKV